MKPNPRNGDQDGPDTNTPRHHGDKHDRNGGNDVETTTLRLEPSPEQKDRLADTLEHILELKTLLRQANARQHDEKTLSRTITRLRHLHPELARQPRRPQVRAAYELHHPPTLEPRHPRCFRFTIDRASELWNDTLLVPKTGRVAVHPEWPQDRKATLVAVHHAKDGSWNATVQHRAIHEDERPQPPKEGNDCWPSRLIHLSLHPGTGKARHRFKPFQDARCTTLVHYRERLVVVPDPETYRLLEPHTHSKVSYVTAEEPDKTRTTTAACAKLAEERKTCLFAAVGTHARKAARAFAQGGMRQVEQDLGREIGEKTQILVSPKNAGKVDEGEDGQGRLR